jgi:competence protein ComFC
MLSAFVMLLESDESSLDIFMHPLLQDVKSLVVDTLFPVHCLGCNQEGLFLCLNCQNKLQRLTHQQCIVCQMPSANGLTHELCKKDNTSANKTPSGLISVFDYHDPLLAQTIIWGKYKFLPDAYRLLAKLMIQYLKDNHYDGLVDNPVLCPIPLAKERSRWRGFNQSEIIAQELSKEFGWLIVNVIRRIKNTKTQKDLTKTERLANIANSFSVIDPAAIKDRNAILIDDVVTTGATLLEASRSITKAQTNSVWCLTLARD